MAIKKSLTNIANVLVWPLRRFCEIQYDSICKNVERRERENEEVISFVMAEKHKQILSLDRFIGSLGEYNSMKGEDHEILDLGKPEKQITLRDYYLDTYSNPHYLSEELREEARKWGIFYKELIDKDVCGFIHWDGWRKSGRHLNIIVSEFISDGFSYGTGLPVRKKSNQQT